MSKFLKSLSINVAWMVGAVAGFGLFCLLVGWLGDVINNWIPSLNADGSDTSLVIAIFVCLGFTICILKALSDAFDTDETEDDEDDD